MNATETYRVSERKTLNRGDVFRASGGPYYITQRGDHVSMAAKGPFVFLRHCEDDGREWLEAYSTREGTQVILCLTEGRPSIMPGSLIPRAYTVGSRLREKAAAKAVRRCPAAPVSRRVLGKRPEPSVEEAMSAGLDIVNAVFEGKTGQKKLF